MKNGLKFALALSAIIALVGGAMYLRYRTFDFEAEDAAQKVQWEYETTHSSALRP